MAFNEQLPQWENEGTQPPQSKRVEGWLPNEKPPASWFNWLFHRAYKALQELQQKAVEREEFESHASRHATGGPDEITPEMIGAAPISHGSEHNHDGSDPIPDLVQVQEDLVAHKADGVHQKVVATNDDEATSAVDAPLKSDGGLAVAKNAIIGDHLIYNLCKTNTFRGNTGLSDTQFIYGTIRLDTSDVSMTFVTILASAAIATAFKRFVVIVGRDESIRVYTLIDERSGSASPYIEIEVNGNDVVIKNEPADAGSSTVLSLINIENNQMSGAFFSFTS